MHFEIVKNREEWNNFLKQNRGSFLQSFEWAEFQKRNHKKVWLFQLKKLGEVIFQCLLVKEKFFFNSKPFFYIPFGPTYNKNLSTLDKKKILEDFIGEIKKIAKKEQPIFLNIEPYCFSSPFEGALFRKPIKRIQPQKTIILNLRKSEELLLKNFHFRTRYNIRLAQKKKVEIFKFNKKNCDINFYSDIFYDIIHNTSTRKKFGVYPKNYYKKLLDIYTNDFKSELFLAKYKNDFIAGSIVVFFGKMAVYLHAGSRYQYRQLKAPFALQWSQIIEAKKEGYEDYDFWGIDEKKYPGVTYFKKNFNGKEHKYPLGVDLVFNNKWYFLYKFLKKINQINF